MKKILIISLIISILLGCKKENNLDLPCNDMFLDLYSDQLEHNGDIYVFDYPDNATNSYFKVDYNSLPTQRIYWSSPDSFYVVMFSDTIWTPVVNFSTYADDNGIGHQLVYVNPTLIGDTLNIIGSIWELSVEEFYTHSETLAREILIKIE